jgi:hypothetical protein
VCLSPAWDIFTVFTTVKVRTVDFWVMTCILHTRLDCVTFHTRIIYIFTIVTKKSSSTVSQKLQQTTRPRSALTWNSTWALFQQKLKTRQYLVFYQHPMINYDGKYRDQNIRLPCSYPTWQLLAQISPTQPGLLLQFFTFPVIQCRHWIRLCVSALYGSKHRRRRFGAM